MTSPLRQLACLAQISMIMVGSAVAVTTVPVLDRIVMKDLPVELPLTVKTMGSAAERLGRFAQAPLGIEDAIEPLPSVTSEEGPLALTGMKVRDAVHELARRSATYEWRQVANVIVIRPKVAWETRNSALNRRIESVEWKGVTFAEALDKSMSVLTGTEYKTPHPTPDQRRFDISLRRATLLQLLNRIVIAHGQLIWHVSYNNPDRPEHFGIGLTTFDGHGRWVWIPTFDRARSTAPRFE